MGRRNLKAVGLFDGVANTPNPSSITDSFNNLSFAYTAGSSIFPLHQYLEPITKDGGMIPSTTNSKLGGFSFWIKITDTTYSYNGEGVMSLVGPDLANPLNPFTSLVNVNLVPHFVGGVVVGVKPQLQVRHQTNLEQFHDYDSITAISDTNWHNITVRFNVVGSNDIIDMHLDGVNVATATNPINTTVYSPVNHYVIGVANTSFTPTANPSVFITNYKAVKNVRLNHFIFYAGTAISPTDMVNNAPTLEPFYPAAGAAGFKALYTVRGNRTITTDRLPAFQLGFTPSGSIDFIQQPSIIGQPNIRTVAYDFIDSLTSTNFRKTPYIETLKRFHTWADTTTAIDGSRAFSGAVANGMFMRPAYLPFQTGIGVDTPLVSKFGVVNIQITSFSDVKPMTASYVDDWPNAPSVFGGSGSMYRKAHENTYPTKTIGSITVNNYKAVAPTKDYFTPSFS